MLLILGHEPLISTNVESLTADGHLCITQQPTRLPHTTAIRVPKTPVQCLLPRNANPADFQSKSRANRAQKFGPAAVTREDSDFSTLLLSEAHQNRLIVVEALSSSWFPFAARNKFKGVKL
ncbi:hypothetical protein H5410_055027 [Solanum commersonii]|uniref:Uncharacterized protein n=1 Tax=Solanum commersonii TaxID=4109 RepID=A0A9J5WHH0_SOLCO|nr:hypothetical protein H5410_055027 [Solanum commersonii]